MICIIACWLGGCYAIEEQNTTGGDEDEVVEMVLQSWQK